MKASLGVVVAASVVLSACGGREPMPVQVVRVSDQSLTCQQISAEIRSNERLLADLDVEQDERTGRNAAAVIAGVILFAPILFAMDVKDAAGKEAAALEERNRYLSELRAQECPESSPASVAAAFEAAPEPAASRPPAIPEGPAAPALGIPGQLPVEGAAYAGFAPSEIEWYCAQTWRTAVDPATGRSLYNPCYQRAMFR